MPGMTEPDLRPDLLASACAACHAHRGQALGGMPVLAGIDEKAFLSAMRDFQSGERESVVMQRYALGYTEAELKMLASYFSEQ